jgi:uncharacterized protein (DUF2236 family)
MMKPFVDPNSIVRRIWGDADVILLVFAGAAAEFALNKAVDWLFYTGRLPADPIGRLFSTVRYAQDMVFQSEENAERIIAGIGHIHAGVERSRGSQIPAWAYRDVLYILIDYSERAFALLHRPLTPDEQAELFREFRRLGAGMGVPDLPTTHADYVRDRAAHLANDLEHSAFTAQLFDRYRDALGAWRYDLLRQSMALLVPESVRQMLDLPKRPLLTYSIGLYPVLNALGLRAAMQRVLLPPAYLAQVQGMDR